MITNSVVDLAIRLIPFTMVMLCILSSAVNHFKYRKMLDNGAILTSSVWGSLTCMIGLLVIVLNGKEGFFAPTVMGLILMVFCWHMALLPIMTLQKNRNSK